MSIPVSHVADSVRHSASDAFSPSGLGEGAARVKYAGGLQKKKKKALKLYEYTELLPSQFLQWSRELTG